MVLVRHYRFCADVQKMVISAPQNEAAKKKIINSFDFKSFQNKQSALTA